MEDLSRAEYPSMLANLQPTQAVQTLNERIKRINRINQEVADWFAERRRVEEQYVQALRRLAQHKVPNAQTELGVFQNPWARVIEAVETIAQSHHMFAERIEQDVENPLRVFQQKKDAMNINTMANTLSTTAKEYDEAKDKSEKLSKKGGKASTQKVDAATSKLESVSQQWDSQAPYVFETLQALDESRVNQMRDLLTQYQTFESEQAQRTQDRAVETLAQMLDISTESEIQNFVSRITSGRPRLAPRPSTRQNTGLSGLSTTSSAAPPPPSSSGNETLTPTVSNQPSQAPLPPTPSSQPEPPSQPSQPSQLPEDDASEATATPSEPKPGSKLRRLGTMFGGRRRQSVIGGIGVSPQKGGSGFGRLGGGQGRGVSPRGSVGNLRDTNRLTSLDERPDLPTTTDGAAAAKPPGSSHEGTNGFVPGESLLDSPVPVSDAAASGMNGTREPDVSDVAPPPGPPPSQQVQTPPTKDAEGFSTPAPMNDPISQAQREAAGDDADQLLKLNIQQKPIEEEDPQAKQAAMSSLSNTLRMGPATRRTGTIRGRRDVRNTIYVPSPTTSEAAPELSLSSIPGSPPANLPSRPSAVAALASEASVATSDSQSIRSGTSLGSLAHFKYPEMHEPGLNSAIIETVSAVFENGVISSATIAGEIAFVNNVTDSTQAKTRETIRIDNFPNLERIGPNRIFVQNVAPDQPEQYTLDLTHLSKMSTAFSYKVFAEAADHPSLGQHAPLLLKPAWKPQGDKLGLLLQYQLNPSSKFTGPITLHNVVFMATYGGKASGAQTKPSGTHLKEKQLVYWRLGDVTLTSEMQKIVCRIIGAEGAEPTPGHIEARWEYAAAKGEVVGSGISVSRMEEAKGKNKEVEEDDPFSDENTAADQTWIELPLSRKLVSGKYEGK